MTKYHVNPVTQRPGKCSAVHQCRYTSNGEIPPHFDSVEDANSFIEEASKQDYTGQKMGGLSKRDTVNNAPKKEYSEFEHHIVNLMKIGESFSYRGKTYTVVNSDKPVTRKGEPKTDVYFSLQDKESGEIKEYKLSLKQDNADFIENKISSSRAEGIFGENYVERTGMIIQDLIQNLKKYNLQPLNTEKKTLTAGYRLDIMRAGNRKLAVPISLTHEEKMEIYAGANLSTDKRNSIVNGKVVENSGVANYILNGNRSDFTSPQDVLDRIEPLEEYIESDHFPQHYAILAAVNLRNSNGKAKIDGARPLAVTVDYDEHGNYSYNPCPDLTTTSSHMKTYYSSQVLQHIGLE